MINVAFMPASKVFLNNVFFEEGERDGVLEPFRELRRSLYEKGIRFDTFDCFFDCDLIDIIVVSRFEVNLGNIFKVLRCNPSAQIIMLMTEELNVAPIHNKSMLDSLLFDVVLTWRDDYVDDLKYKKYFYPNPVRKFNSILGFQEKKYLAMINSFKKFPRMTSGDLYVERLRALRFFAENSNIDLFGVGWRQLDDRLIQDVYRGEIVDKLSVLQQYRFSLVFENSSNDVGGVTEKIFDVMAAGCVPVYWGAPNVEDYIPTDTFIDFRRFQGFSELDFYLKNITMEEYERFTNSICQFLKSDEYKRFTTDYFVPRLCGVIDEELKRSRPIHSMFRLRLDLAFRMAKNIKWLLGEPKLVFDMFFK